MDIIPVTDVGYDPWDIQHLANYLTAHGMPMVPIRMTREASQEINGHLDHFRKSSYRHPENVLMLAR
jgi:phage terminase large subunit-like protein